MPPKKAKGEKAGKKTPASKKTTDNEPPPKNLHSRSQEKKATDKPRSTNKQPKTQKTSPTKTKSNKPESPAEDDEDANVKEQLQKKLLEMKAPDTAITNTGTTTPRKTKKLVDTETRSSSPSSSDTPMDSPTPLESKTTVAEKQRQTKATGASIQKRGPSSPKEWTSKRQKTYFKKTTSTVEIPEADLIKTISRNVTANPTDLTGVEYIPKKTPETTDSPWQVMKKIKWEIQHPEVSSNLKAAWSNQARIYRWERQVWDAFHKQMAKNYFESRMGPCDADARLQHDDVKAFFVEAQKHRIEITEKDLDWPSVVERMSMELPPLRDPKFPNETPIQLEYWEMIGREIVAEAGRTENQIAPNIPKSVMKEDTKKSKLKVSFALEKNHDISAADDTPNVNTKGNAEMEEIWKQVQVKFPHPHSPRTGVTPDIKRRVKTSRLETKKKRCREFHRRMAIQDLISKLGNKAENRTTESDYVRFLDNIVETMNGRVVFDETDTWDSLLQAMNLVKPRNCNIEETLREKMKEACLIEEQENRMMRRFLRLEKTTQEKLVVESTTRIMRWFGFKNGTPHGNTIPPRYHGAQPENIDSDFSDEGNEMYEEAQTLRKFVNLFQMKEDDKKQFLETHGRDPTFWSEPMRMSCAIERQVGWNLFLRFPGDLPDERWPIVVDLAMDFLRKETNRRYYKYHYQHIRRLTQPDFLEALENVFRMTAPEGVIPMTDETIALLEWHQLLAILQLPAVNANEDDFYNGNW